jgi:hypothetical protein
MKSFLKKFKKNGTFNNAGPGRRLCDDPSSGLDDLKSTAVPAARPVPTPSEASIAAREAALRRLETTTKKPGTKSGMERLLEQERRKAQQELEALQEIKTQTQKLQITVHPIDQCQKYLCPDLDIVEGLSKQDLWQKMQQNLSYSIEEESVLASMLIKNCNSDSIACQCISTLEIILNNLKTSDADKLEKFKRVKKAKIEQKILNCVGGQMFLEACGFTLNDTQEWYELQGVVGSLAEHADACLATLAFAEKANVILDRQFEIQTRGSPQAAQHEADFFNVKSEDLQERQRELRVQREIQETLMTKTEKDKLTRVRIDTQHTKLMLVYQNATYSAMFKVTETVSDLITFLMQEFNLNSFDEHKILYLNRELSSSDYVKTFKELEMYPSVLLRVQ